MNDRFDIKARAQHDKSWERLTWWINGSLPADQIADLEAHVAACDACANESRALRDLQLRMRDDAVLLAPQSGWQSMAERLDREDDLLAGKVARPARAGRWLGASPSGWRWVAAGQAFLVVGLAATVWWQASTPQHEAPQYVTLTAAPDAVAPHAQQALRMVFRRDASLAEVNALLRELPAQIVAGPSEAGVYTVALQSAEDAESSAQFLARLRADESVLFVEPVTGR